MIYNVKYATDPILIVQGDHVNITIDVYLNGVLYDLTGKSLQFRIVNKHGTIIADWTTTGGELTCCTSSLNVYADSIEQISCCSSLDAQLIEVAPQLTIWKGIIKITGGLI